MRVCILTIDGGMMGVDIHAFQTTALVLWPWLHVSFGHHLVGADWDVEWTVSHQCAPPLQEGYFMEPVGHVPLPNGWGPGEPVILGFTIALGTSQPNFVLEKLTVGGKHALGECFIFVGMNANCGLLSFVNADFNFSTVLQDVGDHDWENYFKRMTVQMAFNSATAALAWLPGTGGAGGFLQNGFKRESIKGLDDALHDIGTRFGIGVAGTQNMTSLTNRFGGDGAEKGPEFSIDGSIMDSWTGSTNGWGNVFGPSVP
jgi:hypothetical protein